MTLEGIKTRWRQRFYHLRVVRALPREKRPRRWWYLWLSLDDRNPIMFCVYAYPLIHNVFSTLSVEEIRNAQSLTVKPTTEESS